MSTDSAATWFARTFGARLPLELAEPLVRTPGAFHWASAQSATLAPSALMVPAFPADPPRYTVIGHWGHGLGSQAFYFVRSAGRHRCFLRVGFGGPYDGPERGREIVAALGAYRSLLEQPALEASEVVYSLGTGQARLELTGCASRALDAAALVPPGAPAPAVDAFITAVAAASRP